MATKQTTTARAQAGEPRRPPRALFKYVVNPVMRTMLRSPLHGRVSKNVMLVTFTGRKSGKKFTTPVAYRREGEQLVSFVDGAWWRNLTGGADVILRVAGRELRASAEPTSDPEAVAEEMKTFLEKHGLDKARMVGIFPPPKRMPTWEELKARAQGRAMVRFTPR